MSKYEQGKIYKIVDNSNGNVYIGSTTQSTLAKRLAQHVSAYKYYQKTSNTKKYRTTSFGILENMNYDIILIETYPCKIKDELTARERYYIDTMECVNKYKPLRTTKEWRLDNIVEVKQRDHNKYMKNKEIIAEQKRIHYEENKEIILKKLNEKFNCQCGGKYTHVNIQKHVKTQKHKTYLEAHPQET